MSREKGKPVLGYNINFSQITPSSAFLPTHHASSQGEAWVPISVSWYLVQQRLYFTSCLITEGSFGLPLLPELRLAAYSCLCSMSHHRQKLGAKVASLDSRVAAHLGFSQCLITQGTLRTHNLLLTLANQAARSVLLTLSLP